jgi:hypothetical protein
MRSCNRGGYGHFGFGSRETIVTIQAHVYSWEQAYGPAPEGLNVLHRCDNRRCVRPTHLWVGTHQDNVNDMVAKGRNYRHPRKRREPPGYARGVRCHTAKLSDDAIREIRQRWGSGNVTQTALATEYGVDQTMISKIVRRQSWTHVI